MSEKTYNWAVWDNPPFTILRREIVRETGKMIFVNIRGKVEGRNKGVRDYPTSLDEAVAQAEKRKRELIERLERQLEEARAIKINSYTIVATDDSSPHTVIPL